MQIIYCRANDARRGSSTLALGRFPRRCLRALGRIALSNPRSTSRPTNGQDGRTDARQAVVRSSLPIGERSYDQSRVYSTPRFAAQRDRSCTLAAQQRCRLHKLFSSEKFSHRLLNCNKGTWLIQSEIDINIHLLCRHAYVCVRLYVYVEKVIFANREVFMLNIK